MGDKKQGDTGSKTGRFTPGSSGNPNGRPRKQPKHERRDTWINTSSGHGTSRDRRILTQYGVDIVTDLEAVNLWRSEWLAARIIEALPQDAFRRGWTLKIDGKSGKKQSEAICARAEELGLDTAFTRAAEFERALGGAALFPVIDGAQGALQDPLVPNRIGRVRAIHVLEPRELVPCEWDRDLMSPQFNLPSAYQLMPLSAGRGGWMPQVRIHASRLIVFPGLRVSNQTQPGQRDGWGDSCLSRPKQVMSDYSLAWGSAATLLTEHGHGVLEMDGYAELLAQAGGEEIVERRFRTMDMGQSTLRSKVIDAKDRYSRSTGTLSGMSDVLKEFAQLMAGAADMPLTRLLGMSPGGMNATGEFDMRGWYDTVERGQTKNYGPRVEQGIKLLFLENGGTEPEQWSADWRPLITPSEKEQAETRKTVAETDKIYYDIQAASSDDIATSRWKGDTYTAEMIIDWKARDDQFKILEEKATELDEAERAALVAPQQQVRTDPAEKTAEEP